MKILFVITSWSFGGAEIQVKQLAYHFITSGHHVKIVSMINIDKSFSKNDNLDVVSLNMKKGIPELGAIFKLKSIIKEFSPNVVHAHMIHAVILSRITRFFVKIPRLISTAHSINEGGKLREKLYQFTDGLSDINTNVSRIGTELYIKKRIFSKEKTTFIPNGIKISKQKNYLIENTTNRKIKKEFNINADIKIGIAVGRLTEAKDYLNMFNAVKILVSKRTDFIILIAGAGKLKNHLLEQIKTLDLDRFIKLIGIRSDILELMKQSDFFIMSSAWEGLPIVILEAASVGLPAVVTNVGGNKEVIKNNLNGYVVPPKNAQELSDKVDLILSKTKSDLSEMGRQSIRLIEKEYALNKIVEEWLNIYKS